MKRFIQTLFLASILACGSSVSQDSFFDPSTSFNEYWYAGQAEITSYELQQARYGEIHSGEAVLIFVTEPFSRSKQVKLDNWQDQSEDNVSVMKLNMTKKFLTGIYPYSMMMSTFVPVSIGEQPAMLKTTTSSQEWCGHTWMQLNDQSDTYSLKGFSYFESEGDIESAITKVLTEDEIWTRIRINPMSLPEGQIELLPSTFYLRLRHQEALPQLANVGLSEILNSDYSENQHYVYIISYNNRELKIYFEESFPHTILGWEETYLSGFDNPDKLTTIAKRINTINSAYWGKNQNQDRAIRSELGLSIE